MLSPRENYLNELAHKGSLYVPCCITDCAMLGCGAVAGPWIEKGPQGGGLDGFGVKWICPESGAGNPMVDTRQKPILEEIEDWESVNIPDLSQYDWEAAAKADLERADRNAQVIEYGIGNGIFERLVALMGFENALCALAIEPEACNDFFKRLTDYKIDFAEQVVKYYKPDVITNYDDIATQGSLFMSPDCYRQLIKPHHKRLYDALKEMGVIVCQHTCGHAESIVEDMIEIGVEQWTSVQPTNDIESLIQKYGDKITFSGGFDSIGPVSQAGCTPDLIINEVHRCVDNYGKYGKGFAFFPFYIVNGVLDIGAKFGITFQEFMPYRMQHMNLPK